MKKEDSAYLYQILESYEGLTNFSTLESGPEAYRDIELHIAPDLRAQVEVLVENLKKEIGLQIV